MAAWHTRDVERGGSIQVSGGAPSQVCCLGGPSLSLTALSVPVCVFRSRQR